MPQQQMSLSTTQQASVPLLPRYKPCFIISTGIVGLATLKLRYIGRALTTPKTPEEADENCTDSCPHPFPHQPQMTTQACVLSAKF